MAAVPVQFVELDKVTADYRVVVEVDAIAPPDEEPEEHLAMCRMRARVVEVRRVKGALPRGRPIEIRIACWPHGKEPDLPGPQRVYYGGPLPGPMQMWMTLRDGVYHAVAWGDLSEEEHPELVPADLRPTAGDDPPDSNRGEAGNPAPDLPGTGRTVPVDALNEDYRVLLPRRGVLAGGGGLVSQTWRVVVDFETAELNAARGKQAGQFVTGPLDAATTVELSPAVLSEIEALARQVSDRDKTPQTVLSADAMGVLIVVDGARAFELMPSGPITAGPAAKLRDRLYELAWPQE